MRRASEPERQTFGDLADFVACGSGLRILRTLEMLAALPAEPSRAPASRAGASGPAALPATRPVPSSRANVEGSPPRSPCDPRRLVLIGESAAAGFLLAPDLTPALALRGVLERHARERWEVVDLAAVDLSATDLIAAARRASDLRPDVVVVYAGNNWPVRQRWRRRRGTSGPSSRPSHSARTQSRGCAAWPTRPPRRWHGRRFRPSLRIVRGVGCGCPSSSIPEVDLRQVGPCTPVAWLPGDGVRRWHEAHQTAIGTCDAGDSPRPSRRPTRMLALDGGHCPTTHRLRASALRRLGGIDEARSAARAEVDARAWDNDPTVPGATSVVQERPS